MATGDTWIDHHIARIRRNLRITAVILLLGVIGTAVVTRRYLANYVRGPIVMTGAELAQVPSAGAVDRYWVTVTGSAYRDLGIYEETTTTRNGVETGKHNSAYYGELVVDGYNLVVRDPHPIVETEPLTLSGALEPFEGDEVGTALGRLKLDPDGAPLAAFKLDIDSFTRRGTIGLCIAGAVVLLAPGLLVRSRAPADRTDHAIVRQLAAYGDATALLAQVDAEVPADTRVSFFVTPSFAIWRTTYSLKILPTQDLIWSHIRTGKAPAVVHHLRSGKVLQQTAPRKYGAQMMSQLAERAPWVFLGYDKRLVTAWKQDRAGLIAAVDQRRRAPKA